MRPDDGYRLLVQGVLDYAIFMLDPDGHITSWNAGAQQIKGYREEEILGKHFSVFYPPEDIAAGKPWHELDQAIRHGRVEDEGWRIRKDGTRFWADVVITALRDETGELRGFGKVTRDTTDRRAAEEALRASEERFRLLVQGVRDHAIFMLDPDGHITSWNTGAQQIKGYREEEILGKHFSVFYPPENADLPKKELVRASRDGRLETEGWRIRKDGTRFWANIVITAMYDDTGTLCGFGKVTRDMTERRAAEQALSERRRLLGHLVEAQELERRRIAWDVHDDSIQAMVAVGMRLQLLAGRLPAEQQELAAQLDEAVRASVGRLRGLVANLRPTTIDQHGLVPSLAGYLRDVVRPWGLETSLSAELPNEPPMPVAITLFRICQEALTNVHKHARATRVDVTLAGKDGGTLVRVSDDGVGLPDPAPDDPYRHFGLLEMRERAEIAGGWWSVTSTPGGGTTIQFWLPTAPTQEEE